MCEREPTGKLNAFDERKVHRYIGCKISFTNIIPYVLFSFGKADIFGNDIGKHSV